MDPASVLGVAASALQIAQFIGSTIQGLHTLRGKFKDADTTIRLIISKLSTIKAAVFQIRDWAEFNSVDSPKERQFMNGLHVALDGCQAAIDVLSEEVKDLATNVKTSDDGTHLPLGLKAKVIAVWSEDTMKAHEDRLHGQVQALQLLLMAGQCRDAETQKSLLLLKENQRLIQKVADDTKTLRESQSSVASQTSRSTRYSTLASNKGGTAFDFENTLQQSQAYNGIDMTSGKINTETSRSRPSIFPHRRISTSMYSTDEGYETGISQPDSGSPSELENHSTSPIDMRRYTGGPKMFNERSEFKLYRSRSIASESTKSEPKVQRWLSISSSSGESSQLQDKSPGTPKKRLWPNRLGRINSLSAVNILSNSTSPKSASPGFSSPKRGHDPKMNKSIDFSSLNGLQTPAIVRAAQAGSGVEIQALLSNGHDIEAYHGPTQRTALAVAAHCGIDELVNLLLRFGANPRTRDIDLCTPLHLAASRDHLSSLQALLDEEIDIEARDQDGQTPLWVAANNGHTKSAELLLKRGAKISARANDQCTALHAVAKRGDRYMVELLLRSGCDLEARDNQFMTAMHHACENGHQHVVEFLLQKGASIEVPGNNSKSPLLCAAAMGHVRVVEYLSKKKASSRSTDEKKANALHLAARNGHAEVVNYLLEWKIPIHDTDIDGLTPLHCAVIGQHFGAVELLLRRRASLDRRCKEGRTPLHYACGLESSDIVNLLLNAGAKPEEEIRGDNRRPIHIAVAQGSVPIVEILCRKGAATDVRDFRGDRPLCIACHYGHIEVVEKLLSYNEPLRMRFRNRPNKDSPLCVAAKAGHLPVVQLLIKRGASVKERDEFGYIPLRYAAYYGHPEVLEELMKEGAELYDEGEDSHGWGFLLMPATIGFSDATDISEDRKNRVRVLLGEMEKRYRDRENSVLDNNISVELDHGQKNIRYRHNPLIPRQELGGSMIRTELPSGPNEIDAQLQKLPDGSPTSTPRPTSLVLVDENVTIVSQPSSPTKDTDNISTSKADSSHDDLTYASSVTSMSLPSTEVAALIAKRQAEIQQLQKYLPSHLKNVEQPPEPDSSRHIYEME